MKSQMFGSQPNVRRNPLRNTNSRAYKFRRKLVPWLFVLPIMVIFIWVIIGPSCAALYYSFTDWNGIGIAHFTGIQNYVRMIGDVDYRSAFKNNLIWLVLFLTIPIAMALFASSFLAPIKKGGLFLRGALFVPYILPSVIVSNLWQNLLRIDTGLGGVFAKIGLPMLNRAWFGNTSTSLLSSAFVDNWHWWGFLMVLFLTSMQSIPSELYDAARVDGANRWQEFWNVTLPGIRPTLVFLLIMTGIWSFLAFDYVWISTQGGPAGSSNLLSVLVFKNAFMNFDAGYAAAIGLSMSFFAGIIIIIYLWLRRRGWEI